MRIRSCVIALLVAALFMGATAAAFAAADYSWIPLDRNNVDCMPCHYGNNPALQDYAWNQADGRYGPHGYYFDTTNRCVYCHTMHAAESTDTIFQEATGAAHLDTISQLCFTCHDSTSKMGVYSQVTALGFTVKGQHRLDATYTIPGSTLPAMLLTCDSCHTPHNNTKMAGHWVSFNPRTSDAYFSSATYPMTNRLLRDDVGGKPPGTYTQYGSAWCAACHNQRHSGAPGIKNHPTDNTSPYQAYVSNPANAPELGVFIFGPVSPNQWDVANGRPGRISPRPTAPRCQQCHETAMQVEGEMWDADNNIFGWGKGNMVSLGERARMIDPDGPGPSQPTTIADSFPHQTTTFNLLVESGDDLCLNCHLTSTLP